MRRCSYAAHVGAFADAGDFADHVGPGFAVVAGHLHIAIVSAHPDQASAQGRFTDGGDAGKLLHAVVTRQRVFVGNFAEDGLLIAIDAGGEIGAQALPGIAAIGGFE